MTALAVRPGVLLGLVGRIVAWLLITVFVAAIAVLLVLPRLTDGAALTVLSGSMSPELPVGSVVIERSVDATALRVGDIATYQQAGGSNLITHRIVSIDTSGSAPVFVFRGDRNPVADPQPVPAAAIRGKVWFHVPYLGTLRERLGHNRPTVVLIAVIGLGAFSVWQFGSVWRDRRRRPA